jgi:hypothetical protein
MGLTAKAALDQLFSSFATMRSWGEIFGKLASAPFWHIAVAGQAVIFLVLAFRFYLGSLRYHQMRGNSLEIIALFWDVVGTAIIFVGFYLSALLLRSKFAFYPMIAATHLADAVWFGAAWLIGPIPDDLQNIMKKFIRYDAITVVGFVLIAFLLVVLRVGFGEPYWFQGLCFVFLGVVSLWDFRSNNAFYKG